MKMSSSLNRTVTACAAVLCLLALTATARAQGAAGAPAHNLAPIAPSASPGPPSAAAPFDNQPFQPPAFKPVFHNRPAGTPPPKSFTATVNPDGTLAFTATPTDGGGKQETVTTSQGTPIVLEHDPHGHGGIWTGPPTDGDKVIYQGHKGTVAVVNGVTTINWADGSSSTIITTPPKGTDQDGGRAGLATSAGVAVPQDDGLITSDNVGGGIAATPNGGGAKLTTAPGDLINGSTRGIGDTSNPDNSSGTKPGIKGPNSQTYSGTVSVDANPGLATSTGVAAPPNAGGAKPREEDVVVTGSRIPHPENYLLSPVTAGGQQEVSPAPNAPDRKSVDGTITKDSWKTTAPNGGANQVVATPVVAGVAVAAGPGIKMATAPNGGDAKPSEQTVTARIKGTVTDPQGGAVTQNGADAKPGQTTTFTYSPPPESQGVTTAPNGAAGKQGIFDQGSQGVLTSYLTTGGPGSKVNPQDSNLPIPGVDIVVKKHPGGNALATFSGGPGEGAPAGLPLSAYLTTGGRKPNPQDSNLPIPGVDIVVKKHPGGNALATFSGGPGDPASPAEAAINTTRSNIRHPNLANPTTGGEQPNVDATAPANK